jgi:CO/xanthine dehydrogenase FAD-binding subunit
MDGVKGPGTRQIFFPSTFQELFSQWSRFPDGVLYAGGGELLRSQGKILPDLPGNILSLNNLEELRRVSRTERYLEVGALVTLSEIIDLGKIVPEILTQGLLLICGSQMRNLASLGGTICAPRRMDLTAPLVALDAHYELRAAPGVRWISASRFSSLPGTSALGNQELLCQVRIPLEQWNYSLMTKFVSSWGDEPGGMIVLLAKTQKDFLTDLRIVYSGSILLRDRNSEALFAGKKLPLDRRHIENGLTHWRTFLSGIQDEGLDDFTRDRIVNFIEVSLMGFAE